MQVVTLFSHKQHTSFTEEPWSVHGPHVAEYEEQKTLIAGIHLCPTQGPIFNIRRNSICKLLIQLKLLIYCWTFSGGSEPRLIAAATAQLNTLPFYHSFWNHASKPSLVFIKFLFNNMIPFHCMLHFFFSHPFLTHNLY